MGALRGSITVRRYRVLGELHREFRARFAKAIRAHAHVPIDPETSDEERSVGWVNVLDPYDGELGPETCFLGGRLLLGLRVDVLKAPRTEVRRMVEQRRREQEGETGRPLSRRERRVLADTVERELRQRLLPRFRITDMAWDLDAHQQHGQGRLYLWSTSKKTNETFLELFAKTFGHELEPEGPGLWARDRLLARARKRNGAPARDDAALEAAVDRARDLLAQLQPTRELLFGFQGVRPGVAADELAETDVPLRGERRGRRG